MNLRFLEVLDQVPRFDTQAIGELYVNRKLINFTSKECQWKMEKC